MLDALGANIRVDTRGAQVMRVLPRLNDDVNEEWISDKTRHAIDGLRHQRLDRPYVRRGGKLAEATWDEAFAAIAAKLGNIDGAKVAAIAGDQCDAESMVALKDLMAALGSPNVDCRQDGAKLEAAPRGSYIFNPGIRGIDAADAILLIGTNPRWESPVLNARIRKRYLHGRCAIGSIGPAVDLTYPVERLGAGPATLRELVDGKVGFFEKLKAAKNPLIIVGMGALARDGRCGGAGDGPRARRQRWAPCAPTGTVLPSCIPRRRASAGSISASCRARAVATWRASWPAARSARSTWSICWPPTRSTPSGSARPS